MAQRHGAYELASDGGVRRVLYRAPEEDLERVRLPSGDGEAARVAKVCGVVFFDEMAAARLLHLAFDPAFEPCSYLGIDNGAQPCGFSLYLDLLACLGQDVDSDDFVGPTSLAGQVQVGGALRAQLWRRVHGQIHLAAVVAEADDSSQYWSVRTTEDYVRLVAALEEGGSSEGWPEQEAEGCSASAWVVNSALSSCDIGAGAIIESSAMEGCTVGAGAVCSGLKRVQGLEVPPKLSVQQVSLLSAGPAAWPAGSFCVLAYVLEDEGQQQEAEGSFLAQPWEEFLRCSGASAGDLWDQAGAAGRTLHAARLFPVVQSVAGGSLGLLWLEYAAALLQEPPAVRAAHLDLWRRRWLQVWRRAPRLSLGEVLTHADVGAELRWQDVVAAETNVLRARELLLRHRDLPLRHILDDEVRRHRWGLLEVFDEVAAAEETPLDVAARALAQVAELLAAFGGTEGGLRSGSARNPQWRGALARLTSREPGARRSAVLEMRALRSQWVDGGPAALIRAARHYEAAAQVLILLAVATCSEFIAIAPAPDPRPPGDWVVVEAPARIDLAGGWTDTPPVCYDHGGTVVNLALLVDGERPIGAKAQRLAGRWELIFETRSGRPGSGSEASTSDAPPVVCRSLADLEDYNSPSAPAALLKCCVLCCGIVSVAARNLAEQLQAAGGGLHLVSWSCLPQGSGLGSSSILAAAVMKAILVAFGLDMDDESLIHAVQNVEQMLTTGGGWQDQVGAILGGAKITRSAPQLPLHVVPEVLPLGPEFAREISSRLVLVFTGRPRLAKHLLQNVIRQWFSRMPEICGNVRGLVANAEAAAEAIRAGDLAGLGACLSAYWEQKKVMAPGCEPRAVAELRERLAPGLLGFSLAGAGGGGFAALLTREPGAHGWVREALKSCPGMEAAYVCEAAADFGGLTVS